MSSETFGPQSRRDNRTLRGPGFQNFKTRAAAGEHASVAGSREDVGPGVGLAGGHPRCAPFTRRAQRSAHRLPPALPGRPDGRRPDRGEPRPGRPAPLARGAARPARGDHRLGTSRAVGGAAPFGRGRLADHPRARPRRAAEARGPGAPHAGNAGSRLELLLRRRRGGDVFRRKALHPLEGSGRRRRRPARSGPLRSSA